MDLSVDASLDDTNSDLKAIKQEFDDCETNASDDASIWGQSDLAGAMGDFANNWWVHRGQIENDLETLSGNVDKACSSWSDADKQLSQSLTTQSSTTGGGAAQGAIGTLAQNA